MEFSLSEDKKIEESGENSQNQLSHHISKNFSLEEF